MIRCVRLWTGPDGHSLFEEGTIDLSKGARGDVLSDTVAASGVAFRETGSDGSFAAHNAPVRQYVLTLAGTPEVRTGTGATFVIRPGDVLIADDTTGSGHSWRLTGDQPWRRAYVIVGQDTVLPFVKTEG